MLILGIETSCDETAAAVVDAGNNVLSNVVYSQIELHKEYGGVVPELASRKHIETISGVIQSALDNAGIEPHQLQGIGVTRGPGLIGSLLVGISAAKAMALALNIPIIGVNHLHGHLSAINLEHSHLRTPFVALAVSGGHTSLYLIKDWLDIEVIGKTRDDAAGEAFDKIAKLLGLGYPGGVVIQNEAKLVDGTPFKFPKALMESGNFDFSFSGLKTSVLRQIELVTGKTRDRLRPGSFHPLLSQEQQSTYRETIRQIAAAFQIAVVEVLAAKSISAAQSFSCSQLVVCGGVAANEKLREHLYALGAEKNVEVLFPSFRLCTDNAAMIGARAHFLLEKGIQDDLHFDAKSRW